VVKRLYTPTYPLLHSTVHFDLISLFRLYNRQSHFLCIFVAHIISYIVWASSIYRRQEKIAMPFHFSLSSFSSAIISLRKRFSQRVITMSLRPFWGLGWICCDDLNEMSLLSGRIYRPLLKTSLFCTEKAFILAKDNAERNSEKQSLWDSWWINK